MVPANLGPLSAAEQKTLDAAFSGEMAMCGPNWDYKDERNNPKNADKWKPERRIRAELLAWLCTNEQARKRVHQHGLQVYAADITGRLDLSFANIPFQVRLNNCRLREDIDLSRTEVFQLALDGCLVQAIIAYGLIVKNNLVMGTAFASNGEVGLEGAQIGGNLDCIGGTFTNPGGEAIEADGINVKGYVYLREGFTANGGVRLVGAQIGGNLECGGGTFTNPKGQALNVDSSDIKGGVYLRDGFTANGEVQIMGAQIGGDLACVAGTFNNQNGSALNCDGINVKSSVFLSSGFTANGEVRFLDAQIGGILDCSGGSFTRENGSALSAFRLNVKGTVWFNSGFTVTGVVSLQGATIGGDFVCSDGHFQNAALVLTDASAATLTDSGLNDIPAGQPADVSPTVWPPPGYLHLDGFVYGRIASEGRINVGKRLDWLGLQPGLPFRPRPYLQLARVLRESGDDVGSKRVLIEMEDRSRKGSTWGPVARPLLRWTIGYGHDPLRAFWWAAGLSAVGWIIYRRSYVAGGMVPSDKDAYKEFKEKGSIPGHYRSFSALMYSIESSLPLVKLGQGDKWQPDPDPAQNRQAPIIASPDTQQVNAGGQQGPSANAGNTPVSNDTSPSSTPVGAASAERAAATGSGGETTAASATGHTPVGQPSTSLKAIEVIARLLIGVGLKRSSDASHEPSFLRSFATSPRFVIWFLWFQILLGWLLATLFVAGISGVVHK